MEEHGGVEEGPRGGGGVHEGGQVDTVREGIVQQEGFSEINQPASRGSLLLTDPV